MPVPFCSPCCGGDLCSSILELKCVLSGVADNGICTCTPINGTYILTSPTANVQCPCPNPSVYYDQLGCQWTYSSNTEPGNCGNRVDFRLAVTKGTDGTYLIAFSWYTAGNNPTIVYKTLSHDPTPSDLPMTLSTVNGCGNDPSVGDCNLSAMEVVVSIP